MPNAGVQREQLNESQEEPTNRQHYSLEKVVRRLRIRCAKQRDQLATSLAHSGGVSRHENSHSF